MLLDNDATAGVRQDAAAYEHLAAGTLRPTRTNRLLARLRPRSLDRRLIAGDDPASSPQLAARAARLASPRERTGLAEGLERLLAATRGPRRRWWAVSARDPLLANAAELRELAALLRSPTPLYAPGIAIVHELITDGSGPVYTGTAELLGRRLDEARAAMRA